MYGRQGGTRLPRQSDYEQEKAFAEAVADGCVVHGVCLCTWWWLAACDVGNTCDHCGAPMAPWDRGST